MTLPLPGPIDVLRVADWVELRAAISGDRNASRTDLLSALKAASVLESRGPEAIEALALDVFAELSQRAKALSPGYPFEVAGGVLRLVGTKWRKSSYMFCLCLSFFGEPPRATKVDGQTVYPRRIFEVLSREVAGAFVGGDAVRFGSPRIKSEIPTAFKTAIDVVCRSKINEGQGFRDQESLNAQDYGLDIIAWRDHHDRRPGKMMLFGACASGWDWEQKLTELQPMDFCKQWLTEAPVSPLIKAFFIPHHVGSTRWTAVARRAGIIFDRCRIAHVLPALPPTPELGDGTAWVRAKLDAAAS